MAAQLPIVAFFMFRWMSMQLRESMQVFAILGITWLANFAGVYWLTLYLNFNQRFLGFQFRQI